MMINILADKHIYKIEQLLPDEVKLTLFDPQKPLTKIPDGTQALLTRTTMTIDESFICSLPSSLQFIATASAGIDHVDISCLQKNNIAFANAAGCNARAVGEYVTTALILWADARKINLQDLKVGIIGAGNTGIEVQKLLSKTNIKSVAYDPPREEREESFISASLNDILACDILTFHTPLTFEADYPTYHWLNEEKLANQSFKLLINASRGGVANEKALFKAYKKNDIEDYILDVWENEPIFSDQIAKSAFIHTPHIAGYSIQAKLKATKMVVYALCNHFELEKAVIDFLQNKKRINLPKATNSLPELLHHFHPINDYHQKFSTLIGKSAKEKRNLFNRLRTGHPLRNEYCFLKIENKAGHAFPAFNNIFR